MEEFTYEVRARACVRALEVGLINAMHLAHAELHDRARRQGRHGGPVRVPSAVGCLCTTARALACRFYFQSLSSGEIFPAEVGRFHFDIDRAFM